MNKLPVLDVTNNNSLETDSEHRQVKFKRFIMHDIFEPLKVIKAKKSEVRNFKSSEFCVPVVYAKFGNNGIMYWGRKNQFTTYENVISIVYNGAIAAGKVYAQEEPTGILAESYFIRYKYKQVSFRANLYMSQVIEHKIYPIYSRENLAIWNGRVENESIDLPVTSDGKPDFDYMEDYIKELEEDRIKELEEDRIKELDAYLKATNLDDYELTDEDKKYSLSRKSTSNENGSLETDCENGQVRFKKVRIGSLFDVHPTKSYKLKNRELFATGGNVPVLSNSSTNNGIGGYCGLEPTEEGKIITFSDTTTGADTMFYQKEPFIGYPHVQGMYPYNSFAWNEKRYLYLISAIRKSAGDGWSYAVKFNRALVCELMVELPVTVDSEPDFDYMERYIRAIEKLTIADVVKYKDKVIDTTKMLVNSQS